MKTTYKDAGVDIDAGGRFVELIKDHVKATHRHGVMGDIGGFGGFFALDELGVEQPVLVAGTDGVGTKLRIAIEMGRFDTVGVDLVAMCVNDIACSGAQPLFFLDYFATAKLKPTEHAEVVKGIAGACGKCGCALIGGETAEMPDMYADGDFDIAGFAVGIVDRRRIIDGSSVGVGNAIIGVASTGFHSNGYSLVRKVVSDAKLNLGERYDGIETTLGEALLEPTALYSPLVAKLTKDFDLHGIAHITGGGFWENIPRILPAGVAAQISRTSWTVPEIFRFLQRKGSIEEHELFRVFNCGIGMVIVLPADQAGRAMEAMDEAGFSAYEIGSITKREAGGPAVVME